MCIRDSANTFANMMGPVIGNIGNLQFVLTAVLGGFLSVQGIGGITLGVMASYLQFTKSFTQPFMQVAQQFNAIVMALAGAERIFNLIDEKPEADEMCIRDRLIVHAKTRKEAIAKMRSALGEVIITGIDTNVDYQYEIMSHPDYQAGNVDIEFISEKMCG